MEEDIFITLAHILGADQESWKLEVTKSYKMKSIFGYIQKYLDIYL